MHAIKIVLALLVVALIIFSYIYWNDIKKLWTKQSRPGPATPHSRPLPPNPVVPVPIPEPTQAAEPGENTGQELSPSESAPLTPSDIVFPSGGLIPNYRPVPPPEPAPITPEYVPIIPEPVPITPIPEPTQAPEPGENTGQELSPAIIADITNALSPGGLFPGRRIGPQPVKANCTECSNPELVYCPNEALPYNLRTPNAKGLLLSKYRVPQYDPATPNAIVNGVGYYVRQGANGCV